MHQVAKTYLSFAFQGVSYHKYSIEVTDVKVQ